MMLFRFKEMLSKLPKLTKITFITPFSSNKAFELMLEQVPSTVRDVSFSRNYFITDKALLSIPTTLDHLDVSFCCMLSSDIVNYLQANSLKSFQMAGWNITTSEMRQILSALITHSPMRLEKLDLQYNTGSVTFQVLNDFLEELLPSIPTKECKLEINVKYCDSFTKCELTELQRLALDGGMKLTFISNDLMLDDNTVEGVREYIRQFM